MSQPALVQSAELHVTARATVPAGGLFRGAWAILAAGAVALLWVMQGVWASQPEMNDRFLIPLASAYLTYRLWPRWQAVPPAPAVWGLAPVVLGATAFALGWFLLVHVGPRVVLLWWLLGSLAAAAFGLSIVQFGTARTRLILFPVLFTLMSLPVPGVVMNPLQRVLQGGTTAAASTLLRGFGLTVERHGYVLSLPSGDLGVVEACSGVRSVSALTAIAILVAYLRGFRLARGAVLLALTLGIVIVSNTVRVVASGLIQETVGRWAIEGWFHEVLGALVVLVGLGLIVWVSGRIAARPAAPPAEPGEPVLPVSARGGWAAVSLLAAAALACGWSEQFRQSHREEVRLDGLPATIGEWTGRDMPVDAGVAEMLKCDQLVLRTYVNPLGQEVQVYLMFWATPASTAHIHHPDVCWPSRGWQAVQGEVRPVERPGRPPLPVSSRLYTQERLQQIVYYWTQRGNEVLPDGVEPPGTLWSEYAWVTSLLRGGAPMGRQARLSVLLGTDVHGSVPQQQKTLARFTAALADEVFRLCPWAEPAPARNDSPAAGTGL